MHIHVVNLRTHQATTLPDSAGLWTFSPSLGLTPDDSILLASPANPGEIYAADWEAP